MSTHLGLSTLAIGMVALSFASPALADPTEEALLPIERKISTFSIRVTKTGYTHFASGEAAPVGADSKDRPLVIEATERRESIQRAIAGD